MLQDTPLTEKQRYWLEHALACDKSGLSIKAYAKANALSLSAFYSWRKILRRKGMLAGPPSEARPLFCKAEVSSPSRARALLPCGMVLEFDLGADPLWVAGLLRVLS